MSGSTRLSSRLKKSLLVGSLFVVIALGVVFSGSFAQAPLANALIGETVAAAGSFLPTATPFQPDASFSGFAPEVEIAATPSPMSTITVEGGIYPTPLTLPTLSSISPYSLPAGVNPLTGTIPAFASQLDRRPVAVKITLFPRYVRPESGLNLADVVFEYYTEWGLSRFIGVFYGNQVKAIGPVRSGRYFDAHVAHMYHAYLVFKFADPRVYNYLKESDLSDFLIVPDNAVGAIYSGPNTFDSYNNYFFDMFKFDDFLERKGMDNSRQQLRSGYFSAMPPAFHEAATRIYTQYSVYDYHYWDYDPALHQYFRFQETDDLLDGKDASYAPLVDTATSQQVTADNVVVLFAPYTFANQFDEEDEVFHIDLINAGEAYVFRDGVVIPANWWRLAQDQPLVITDTNGIPLPLKPGRTFYEVIGITSARQQSGSTWYFKFDRP